MPEPITFHLVSHHQMIVNAIEFYGGIAIIMAFLEYLIRRD